jgi:hypothetical protein
LEIPEWGCYVEMKRQRGGKLSADQVRIHADLRRAGKRVIVAKGWEDAAYQVLSFRRKPMELSA